MSECKIYEFNGGDFYKSGSYTEQSYEWLHLGGDVTSNLFSPVPIKGVITNKSRLEHGTRSIVKDIKQNERGVTLNLVIIGDTRANHMNYLNELKRILYKGHFAIKIPEVSNDVFFLTYQSCQSYSFSRSGKVSKIAIKTMEYNPDQRAFIAQV